MKKILSSLLVFVGLTTSSTTIVACTGYDFNGGNVTPTPPDPIPKDIKYYKILMKESQNTVNDFVSNIKELEKYKNDKDMFPTPEDYIRIIAELKAEQASYQATIYDCQYQILYLQVQGHFNPTQKIQAVKYLQNEITQFQQELATKKLYQNDYDKSELTDIENQIKTTQTILNNLLKP